MRLWLAFSFFVGSLPVSKALGIQVLPLGQTRNLLKDLRHLMQTLHFLTAAIRNHVIHVGNE